MALNIRVADIQAVYHAWRARGAEFSPRRWTVTVRSAATCATQTDT
jgi:hypothetical protein